MIRSGDFSPMCASRMFSARSTAKVVSDQRQMEPIYHSGYFPNGVRFDEIAAAKQPYFQACGLFAIQAGGGGGNRTLE